MPFSSCFFQSFFSRFSGNCKKLLDSGNITEHDGEMFCTSCYRKFFGPKGYGFGGGAGTLSMDDGNGYKVKTKSDFCDVITVWKMYNFSSTKILRENLLLVSKPAIWQIFFGSEFWLWQFFVLINVDIFKKYLEGKK